MFEVDVQHTTYNVQSTLMIDADLWSNICGDMITGKHQ